MENNSTAELRSLILNRSSTYRFLARIYRVEVDKELLEQMSEIDPPINTDVDLPEITEGYRMLKGFLKHLTKSTITDLAVEYATIFLGVSQGRKGGAYPYESVYTSPDRLVVQEARDQVLKAYREEGLDRGEDFDEPEDHIALELEFMSYLCQKTAEALESDNGDSTLGYLEKQKYFLEKHLIPWVPAFCDDVQRLAQGDFYKAVAKITIGYLDMEQNLIGKLIDEIQGSKREPV